MRQKCPQGPRKAHRVKPEAQQDPSSSSSPALSVPSLAPSSLQCDRSRALGPTGPCAQVSSLLHCHAWPLLNCRPTFLPDTEPEHLLGTSWVLGSFPHYSPTSALLSNTHREPDCSAPQLSPPLSTLPPAPRTPSMCPERPPRPLLPDTAATALHPHPIHGTGLTWLPSSLHPSVLHWTTVP